MISHYFFGPQPIPTRFDKCIELKEIAEKLRQLRNKENELNLASQKAGAGSPDYAKSVVISNLVTAIDTAINAFNEQDSHEDHNAEVRDMVALIDVLTTCIGNVLRDYFDTINIFRNKQRENMAVTMRSVTFASTVVTFFAMPISLIPRLGVIFGLGYAESNLEDLTGVNSRITRSVALLNEFQSLLREAKVNLQFAIRLGRNDGLRQIAPEMNHDNALLFTYSNMTKTYIDAIRRKPKQIRDLLDELKLTEAEEALFIRYECPISRDVMNIPVIIGMEEFDVDSILSLPVDEHDQREHPTTREKFYVRDIHPTKTYGHILDLIEHVKQARLDADPDKKSERPRPSAPPL